MTESPARPPATPLLAMAGILCAHLLVFTPVVLFSGNAEEFTAPLADVARLWLVPTLVVFLVLFLPRLFLRDSLRYAAVLAVLGLLCWLQATILVWDYGLLDGRPIDWTEGLWRGLLDTALWLVAIVAAFRLPRRHFGILYRAAVVVFLVHAAAAGHAVYESQGRVLEAGYVTPKGSMEQAPQFSSEANVLHILLDGFQADVFGTLLAHEVTGPRYRKAFEGFTWYNETVSAFLYTQFSVPSFLSGRVYNNQMPKDDFLDEVFRGKTILNEAHDRGYEVDLLVGGTYLSNRLANSRFTNLINIDTVYGASALLDATRLIELALFRAAPHFVKPTIYNEQKWLASSWLEGKEHGGLYYFKHTEFLEQIIRDASVTRSAPVYKYLHVMNTHRPMVVDLKCRYAGRVLPDTRENLTAQSRCTLDVIARLMERLKELGIYDDMLIIMQSDHGGWVPNLRRGPPIRVASGAFAPPVTASLASPLLTIKLPGATGPVRTRPAFASLLDLPDTIADILGWDVNFDHRSLLTIEPGESRVRRHYFSEWSPDEWDHRYALPIQEFLIDGSHYEVEWKPGEVFEAPGDLRKRTPQPIASGK